MEQFHDLLRRVRNRGIRQRNERTGELVRFLPGQVLHFDMADGFPAITTKQLFFKQALGELFGFFRGYQSARRFREDLGCKVWDTNANTTPAWLANPARKGVDDLGRIYGAQWTNWQDWRETRQAEEAIELQARGFQLVAVDLHRPRWVLRRGINQLEKALRAILTNPSDRGIIVTAWRPDEFDRMALRPCHVDYQFIVDTENKVLHLSFYQRSWDLALGWNTVLGALFLHIMARLAGLTAGTLTQHIGDAHLYEKHLPGIETMLAREHFPQPTLVLDGIERVTEIGDIEGVFARMSPAGVRLEGYQHHPKVAFEMTA